MTFPRDSFVTAPADIRRLSDQNQRVLARLQRGPAHRRELLEIATGVTQRISDLREAGYEIPKPVKSIYRLVRGGESSATHSNSLRASEPSDVGEQQDLRAHNETAPSAGHDINEWGLR